PALSQAQGADPDGRHSDLAMEGLQELGRPLDGHLDVLDHLLPARSAPELVDPGGDPVPALEGDDPPVDVAAQPAPGPETPQAGPLHPEGARAPEPVGVPAPEVVTDGEEVLAPAWDRAVVDLLARVVGGVR